MRCCGLNIVSCTKRKDMPSHVLEFLLSQNSILYYSLVNQMFFFLVELPVLDHEIYHAVKPGLSAYKDRPEEVCMTV